MSKTHTPNLPVCYPHIVKTANLPVCYPHIVKIFNVCGGEAVMEGRRIAVWHIVTCYYSWVIPMW